MKKINLKEKNLFVNDKIQGLKSWDNFCRKPSPFDWFSHRTKYFLHKFQQNFKWIFIKYQEFTLTKIKAIFIQNWSDWIAFLFFLRTSVFSYWFNNLLRSSYWIFFSNPMSLAQTYEFKYPPDPKRTCSAILVAMKHRLATRIWKGVIDENNQTDVCECCGRKIGDIEVPTISCYQSEQLSFLGVGLPLFFSFLRYSILLLFILGLIFCIFGLYTNIVSKNCSTDSTCV